MPYECQLVDRAAQPAMIIRARTPMLELPQVLGVAMGAIAEFLASREIQPTGAPFVAYHNMDMQDLDIEIGFPVAETVHGVMDVQPGEIPGGMVACTLHTGPYSKVSEAYDALNVLITERSLQPTGVAYEFYLNDPMTTPEERLQTEVVLPLK